jgi:L-ascorbate metabolism protein UlaG (beta-lactamase superfamily)
MDAFIGMNGMNYVMTIFHAFSGPLAIVGFMTDDRHMNVTNFDGRRFFNLESAEAKGALDLIRWKLKGQATPWPAWIADPVFPPPPTPLRGQQVVSFINHATTLIQNGLGVFLTDPVFSNRTSPVQWAGPKRVRKPGLSLDELPKVDVLLLSHNHYDHLDVDSLRVIAQRFQPHAFVGLGDGPQLRSLGFKSVQECHWWQSFEFRSGRITYVPAQHFSGRGLFDRNKSLWGGFVIESDEGKTYFAGDTGYGAFFKDIHARFGAMDFAMLPIGAYAPRWFMKSVHMNPEEAVKAHLDLCSRRSLAIHFGTWQLTDEGVDDPLRELEKARDLFKLDEKDFGVLGHGESWVL